jgi:formate dehydrogenase iron-sulfur subunit
MVKGLLIDTTRCIGCRGCQVACKSWNELPAEKTSFSDSGSNPRYLDANNFTRVLFRESTAPGGAVRWSFVKRQCMHCLEPACASACPVGALVKLDDGPVVYRDDRCIGCRYCMLACPFQIPKYEWGSRVPYVRKCTLCADRLALGKEPACVATCAGGALLFGDRDKLLAEAHRRIESKPGHYAPEVYGEKSAGGTSVLYLAAIPLQELGLENRGFRTDLGEASLGQGTQAWMSKVPWIAVAAGVVSAGLFQLNRRRDEVKKQEGRED